METSLKLFVALCLGAIAYLLYVIFTKDVREVAVIATMPIQDAPEFNLYDIEQYAIMYTNAERYKRGTQMLLIDRDLMAGCRMAAIHCAKQGGITRSSSNENVAMGTGDINVVVKKWVYETPHLLNPGYTRMGVACYRSPTTGKYYWVQRFR